MAGESKYPLKKMLALAWNGITSFSVKPISFITGLGVLIICMSVLAAIYAFVSYATGHVVAGWTSLILSIWFIGGVQLLSIGLIGQYIGKIYIEVKHRPRYNIETLLSDQKQE
jgi:glycosyltransferase involved in cell wall biosynthesis